MQSYSFSYPNTFMVAKDKEFDPQVIATTLMGCVQDTFEKMCHVTLSKPPEFVEKEIIEYGSYMRVFGPEKFNGSCYIAAINFHIDKKKFKEKDSCGVMVLYIHAEAIGKLMKGLGQPGLDEDDEETLLDICGEFCNVIAGQFKNELRSFGYIDLIISAPLKYKNDIPEGVNFRYSEYKLYELSFHMWKEKMVVVDATMAPVPHA